MVFFHDNFGGLVQIARPAVITQPLPERKHFLLRSGRQIGNAREAHHPALEIRDDRLDACLLEHDLGNPDNVWGRGIAPGQFASLVRIPR